MQKWSLSLTVPQYGALSLTVEKSDVSDAMLMARLITENIPGVRNVDLLPVINGTGQLEKKTRNYAYQAQLEPFQQRPRKAYTKKPVRRREPGKRAIDVVMDFMRANSDRIVTYREIKHEVLRAGFTGLGEIPAILIATGFISRQNNGQYHITTKGRNENNVPKSYPSKKAAEEAAAQYEAEHNEQVG